jgi:hypothetical protein
LYIVGPAGVILDKWYQGSVYCGVEMCSVANAVTLTGGAYSWYVISWSLVGTSVWSEKTDFTTDLMMVDLRDALTEPAHNGAIGTDNNPVFKWKKVSGADWYRLFIVGPSGTLLDQWLEGAKSCSGTVCTATGPTVAAGNYSWYVMTWNPTGSGPWSLETKFSAASPSAPDPVNLRDALTFPAQNQNLGTTYNPTFTWKKVDNASYYRLYIVGPSGPVLDSWFQGSVYCGASSCAVPNAVTLGGGSYYWYVMSWNFAGISAWSDKTDFSTDAQTLPRAVTNLALTGTTTKPTYTWKREPMATWYHVYVKGPSGVVQDTWHQAVNACLGDLCSADSLNTLTSGNYTWWVQTYNVLGYGPWKSSNFKISP